MTSSYVKVYALECLILTKMNLTHKSQSLLFISPFCHASQSSYMRSDYGLQDQNLSLFYLQKIQEEKGAGRRETIG